MGWFQDHAVLFALLCAGAAVVYGLGLTRWLLTRPAGNPQMQEIARAVQEGAAAYLRRQYSTIAVVAIVPFLLLGLYHKLGWGTACRRRSTSPSAPARSPASSSSASACSASPATTGRSPTG